MAAPYIAPEPGPTVSKATVRAADLLGMSQGELASVLGISRATASRLVAGKYQIDPPRKEWELALLLIRLFRSLVGIVGPGDEAKRWLRGPNQALGDAPANLIVTAEGLVRVVHYLDAHRGRV